MRRLIAILTMTTLAAVGLSSAAGAQGLPGFRTISGTIVCPGYGSSVRCDLQEITGAPLRAKPASCELDWGTFFGLTTTASRGRMLCAGDTVLGEPVGPLNPKRSWRYRTIRCTALTRASIRCQNRRGHGFTLSATRQRLF